MLRSKARSTGRVNPKRDAWTVITLVLLCLNLLFLIYPLVILLRDSFMSSAGGFTLDHFIKFFSESYYLKTVGNSFMLSFVVTVITLIIGVPLAYFFCMFKIRGKGLLNIIIVLCSMSAPFIGAYSWILLLGRNGLITSFLKDTFGIRLGTIYGFKGIVLVLCLQLFPLVFLYVNGALKSLDNSLLEASESLGCAGFKRFITVIIPLCIPTILAAALMIFMRAFADFGTPLFIGEGYRTFPVEIYNQFMNETGGDKNFAAAVSVLAILITTVIFVIQKWVNGKFQFTINALHPVSPKKAKGVGNILIHVFCYLVVFVAYAPQLYVIYNSFRKTSGKIFVSGYSLDSYSTAWDLIGRAVLNTVLIGALALVMIIVISVLIAYLVVRRNNFINRLIDIMTMIPYVIPGAVVAISLVVAFNRQPLVLVGTYSIMIIALVIRRNAYTTRSSIAILQQIPMSIEEAAMSLGCSRLTAFFKVTLPMMFNGIVSGALLSWISIITELSSAILLYNFATITLTIQIYVSVSRGNYGVAAAMSTILSAITALSLLLFMKISKDKDLVM